MNPNRFDLLKRCTLICLFVNVFLTVIKLGYGLDTFSRALIADGAHSCLDVSTDLFVLYAIKLARNPANHEYPYGQYRYETLANIVVSLMLIAAAIGIAYDGLQSMMKPVYEFRVEVVAVAFLSILLNEMSYRYTFFYAQKLDSDLLKSTAVHQRADAATSAIVLLSAVGVLLGWRWSDSLGAIIIAGLVFYYAIPSLFDSIQELADKGIQDKLLDTVETKIRSVAGVYDFHLLRSRMMAKYGYLDVHVVVSNMISASEGHFIGDEVSRAILQCDKIKDVTVHIDTEDDRNHSSRPLSRLEVITELRAIMGSEPSKELTDGMIIHYQKGLIILDFLIEKKNTEVEELIKRLDENAPKWLLRCRYYLIQNNNK